MPSRLARTKLRLALRSAALLVSVAFPALAEALTESAVPPPFEPIRVQPAPGAVELTLWGRSYRFEAGPLPTAIASQGQALLVGRPRFPLRGAQGEQEIAWQAPEVVEAHDDFVLLRSAGAAPGVRASAETRVEYDGMIAVDLTLEAERATEVRGLRYELPLASRAMQLFSRHLPYDYQLANVDKNQLLHSAGVLGERLQLGFVPTLALGDRRVGVEWWSETNVHWVPAPDAPPFVVARDGEAARLTVTPIAAPLPLAGGASWRDSFALFVFPARPPPERWRSVRFLPHNRVGVFNRRIGTRMMFLATQATFHAQHDGLPASVDDKFQREIREELDWKDVGYMPYGMLTLAPLLHPTTMSRFEEWSAEGKWWRLQPGFDNPVITRTHPELGPGAPYTYPACAARKDYFDWMLRENLATLRKERLDALYFDHGAITRMCVRNPVLGGRRDRQSWEYRNVRDFYKRLYEQARAVDPKALIVIHTHGAPKAIGAFVDFHIFGEALNVHFANGHPVNQYVANPRLYTPDYLALPEGYLDAQFFPPVGGASSVIPQVRWALERVQPGRARGFQRALQAIVLSNDAHAPLWVSDLDTADEIYKAVDRFGDIGEAKVHPWWSNDALIRRPAGLRATAWVHDDRALVVLANLSAAAISADVGFDVAGLGLPDADSVRDLERPDSRRKRLEAGSFRTDVPPRDLRILLLE
jgi:hypothetical protein